MTHISAWKKTKYMFPNCEVLLYHEANQRKVLVFPPENIDTKQFCETVKPYVKTLGLEPKITNSSSCEYYLVSEPRCD